MDAASPARARAAVGSPWRTALFERHRSGSVDGDWPVAVLGPSIAEAVGARSHTLRLSSETAAKQHARHRDIEVEDYARLQRILDEGEWFKQSTTHALGFVEEDGRLWRAVLKVTGDRSKTYLTSFHRVRPAADCGGHAKRWSASGGELAPGGPRTPRSPEGMRVSRLLPAPRSPYASRIAATSRE